MRARVCIALAIAIGGGVFAVSSVWRSGAWRAAPRAPVPPVIDAAAADRAAGVPSGSFQPSQDIATMDPTSRAQVEQRLREEAAALGGSDQLVATSLDLITAYCSGRYDDYKNFSEGLARRPGASPDGIASGLLTEDEWRFLSRPYARAQYALAEASIEPIRRAGAPVGGPDGGRFTSLTSSAYDEGGFDRSRDVWDVVVPVLLAGPGHDGAGERVLLRISFVRRVQDGRWVPVRAGVHDPDGTSSSLPTPWL